MEPIVSIVSEVGSSSSQGTDVAANLLSVQGKPRGKGSGKEKMGLSESGGAEQAGMSTFSLMLKQHIQAVVRDSSKTETGTIAIGTENMDLISESSLGGEIKGAMMPSAEGVPGTAIGGINIRFLLKGPGLPDKPLEELSKELEDILLQSAGSLEKGVVWGNVAVLLREHGLGEGAIQGLLSSMENGKLIPPVSLKGREEGAVQTTKNNTGQVVLDGARPAAAKTGEGPDIVTGPAVRNEDGHNFVDRLTKASTAGNKIPLSDATAAGIHTPPQEGSGRGKDQAPINVALPLQVTDVGKDVPIKEEAVLLSEGIAEAQENGAFRTSVKQQIPLSKDRVDGVEPEGDVPSRLTGGKAAADGDIRDLRVTEHGGKGTGKKEEGNDNVTSLPGRNVMAMDMVLAGNVESGNLFAHSGAMADTKTETAAGLRPELLIEQVAVQSRQGLLNGPGRMKITLNPPQLGIIDMDVLVRNNKVEVVMIASNQEVQQMLKSHADQLKHALHVQGLRVDGFDVMLSGNRGEQGYRFSSGNFSNNGSGGESGRHEEIEARQSLPDILSPKEINGDGNNGGGISLFV